MGGIEAWVKQLVLVVFLVGVAELLLPREGMRKYAHTALGLLVMLAVIVPFLGLLDRGIDWEAAFRWPSPAAVTPEQGGDPAVTGGVPSQLRADVERLEETSRRLTLEAYRRRVGEEVAAVALTVEGVGKAAADISVDEDSTSPRFGTVRSVNVSVTPGTPTAPGVPSSPGEVVPVQPVEVGMGSGGEPPPDGPVPLPLPPQAGDSPDGLTSEEAGRLREAVRAAVIREFGLYRNQVTVAVVP